VIGFDCQSILKIGFGLSITYLWWIWIGLSNSLCTTYGPRAKCGPRKLLIWPAKPQIVFMLPVYLTKHALNVWKHINFGLWICQKKILARHEIWVVHPCVLRVKQSCQKHILSKHFVVESLRITDIQLFYKKNVKRVTRGQFYQLYMSSFYTRGSQKCKKTVKLSVFFALSGSAHKNLLKERWWNWPQVACQKSGKSVKYCLNDH